jgi:hypothetical protein
MPSDQAFRAEAVRPIDWNPRASPPRVSKALANPGASRCSEAVATSSAQCTSSDLDLHSDRLPMAFGTELLESLVDAHASASLFTIVAVSCAERFSRIGDALVVSVVLDRRRRFHPFAPIDRAFRPGPEGGEVGRRTVVVAGDELGEQRFDLGLDLWEPLEFSPMFGAELVVGVARFVRVGERTISLFELLGQAIDTLNRYETFGIMFPPVSPRPSARERRELRSLIVKPFLELKRRVLVFTPKSSARSRPAFTERPIGRYGAP